MLTGGAGGRAMSRAFEDLFGIPHAFAAIQMPGRTDAWLLRAALDAHGLSASDPRTREFRPRYLAHLARELDQPPPPASRKGVLPGVRVLLDALAQRDHTHLALLTGNYESGARMKLQHFDLWRYFLGGAFGDHAVDRNLLLADAMARTADAGAPVVDAASTFVIGDTPFDVAVAKHGGVRSIGVATGSHDAAALHDAGADTVFEDLSDTDRVIAALDEHRS